MNHSLLALRNRRILKIGIALEMGFYEMNPVTASIKAKYKWDRKSRPSLTVTDIKPI